MEDINIEKELCPENGQLITDGELTSAKIVDAELDILECDFLGDGCVEINTSEYAYISLSADHLLRLFELIAEAEGYDEAFNKQKD